MRDLEWYNLHGRREAVPGDDNDTKDAGDAAEYEGDDTTGSETVEIRVRTLRHLEMALVK